MQSDRPCFSTTRYLLAAAVVLWSLAASQVCQSAVLRIDFETEPALPVQPSTFVAAGPAQTYTRAGAYSIAGGVVLGNPTFLPAFAGRGSSPNLYGTSDLGDPSLQPAITLTFPAAEMIYGVSGVLFNGQPITETYSLTGFAGTTVLGTQLLTLAPGFNVSAFANFSYSSAIPITLLRITTPNANVNGWDFFVDTIQADIPEPASVALTVSGIGLLLLLRRRRA